MSTEELEVIIKATRNSINKGMYKGAVKESIEKLLENLKEGLEAEKLLNDTIEELRREAI